MGLQPGSIVENKFQILEEVGAGGMGTVYKAEHLTMSRTVVLKVLSPSANTSKSIIRFQNEAKILGRLKHPGIAEVYDVGVADGGLVYISLEYIDGITMQRFIESEEHLPLSQLIHIFIELADALSHAHAEGVIHRDIKPGNIMLVKTEEGTYKPVLLDFGIAKYDTTDDEQRLTEAGLAIGSPLYMSPEQCAAKKITASSDQYSLGCVLFECLTGKPPFQCDTALDTMQLHLNELPPDPAQDSYTELPTLLGETITLMLAKEPEDRFGSMQELIDELIEVHELAVENESVKPINSESEIEFYNLKRFLTRRMLLTWGGIASVIGIAFTLGTLGFYRIIDEAPTDDGPTEEATVIQTSVAKKVEAKISAGPNIDLSKIPIATDKFMARFSNRTDLKRADFSHSSISDEGSKFLRKSSNLQELRLKNTEMKTLKYLPEFKSIWFLALGQTEIDDAAIENLVSLPRLKILEINDCPNLTDKCLESLKKMPVLESVKLEETNISKSAVLAAAKSMPNCQFQPFLEKSQLFDTIVDAHKLREAGKVGKALPLYKKWVDTISSARGSDSPALIQPLQLMAVCYDGIGRTADGRACFEKAVALGRASGDKIGLATALQNLSQHLWGVEKNLPAAIKARREHILVTEEVGQLEDTAGRDSMYGLAQLLVGANQLGESKKFVRRCMSIDRKMSKDKTLDDKVREAAKIKCGADLNLLGVVELIGNKSVLAEKHLREAKEIIPPPSKPQEAGEAADLLGHLAMALGQQGRHKEAVEYWQQAVDTTKAFDLPSYKDYAEILKKAIKTAEASSK